MSRAFIVMGDKTTHGGTVISADLTSYLHGKAMAREGDKVVCPRCKGIFAISSGAPDMVDGQGRSYARDMDSTDCGARLIASQGSATWSDESSLPETDEGNPVPEEGSEVAVSTGSGICLDCLRKAAHFGSPVVIRE
ncbi:PAAR domain-containing protein [Herbaspirillum rubrisubalbicans]|uniref:PAAR domain-containing protein n=1 Tax=Herbaspirillum rubrisubalbicans TaxID=80842 RepID=UPI001559924C|nr:PAAR domain-containing protein [Herbaspirillum rubrisubalbicans]NQE51473.1 hypothetical protein [Herbaspirillum rubrisubalbicans]